MAKYELVVRRSVAQDLRAIPKRGVKTTLKRLVSLADDPRPHGSEKLSGEPRYRVRQGNYRIIYEIEDNRLVVGVVKIGHRRRVYR